MAKLLLPLVIALCFLAALSVSGASAASASLSVDPATVNTDPNQTFDVTVKLHSDTDLAAAQTNIFFDRQVIQIQDVVATSEWTGASFFVGVAPQTKQQAIDEANNSTGKLYGVATFFTAGAGQVPAGDANFLTVTFKAVAGGTSTIGLTPENPLHQIKATDVAGNTVPVTTTSGQVTVSGATATPTAPPTPTPTPTPEGQTPTPTPTPTASPTPTPTPTLPVQASLAVSPASLSVKPGAEFTLTLTQDAQIPVVGSSATFAFDPSLLQIVSVSRAPAYSKGSIIYGQNIAGHPEATPATGAVGIANVNATGHDLRVAVFVLPPANPIPAGKADAFTVKFKARDGVSGTSPIEISNLEVTDPEGNNIGVTGSNGSVQVTANAPAVLPAAGGTPTAGSDHVWSELAILGGLFALVAGAGAVYSARRRSA
jgi:hypothetical protein